MRKLFCEKQTNGIPAETCQQSTDQLSKRVKQLYVFVSIDYEIFSKNVWTHKSLILRTGQSLYKGP